MNEPSSDLPVAVIGAGFSGTMAALHLLPRLASRPILLCERGERFARGVAYGTGDKAHLLNVRAANMSAYPDRPDHFLDWLAARDPIGQDEVHVTEAGIFVSRHLYGSYLVGLLNLAVARPEGATRLILVPDDVIDLSPEPHGYDLVLASGRRQPIAGAVLAAGNLLPEVPREGAYVANPWGCSFTDGLRPHEPVVVIGSGLTMVDIALHLSRAGFSGPVIAISRRGLAPRTHVAAPAWPTPAIGAEERASAATLLRRLRRETREAVSRNVPWQSVVDSLRPITSELWRGFPPERRDSFLRHARPWWDVHRHRMAPPVGEAVAAMTASGFLTIKAAQVAGLAGTDDGVTVTIRPRGTTKRETIQAQRVIQASGSVAADRCGSPLVSRLIERGLVRLGRHRLGLDQADDLVLIGADGTRAPRLWALGPLGAGTFWECVAVPDIRRQAVEVADAIARMLSAAG